MQKCKTHIGGFYAHVGSTKQLGLCKRAFCEIKDYCLLSLQIHLVMHSHTQVPIAPIPRPHSHTDIPLMPCGHPAG